MIKTQTTTSRQTPVACIVLVKMRDHFKKDVKYSKGFTGQQQSWWKGGKKCPVRSGWGFWACLVWREGCWEMTLLLPTDSQEEETEREVLISSSWDPVTGCIWMAQSCARGALDWTLGSIYLLKGWSNTGTGLLERWWMSQDSVFKMLLDKVTNNMP